MRVCIQDQDGNPVTTGVDLSVSGPDYNTTTLNNSTGCHDFLTATGTYYVSGWCTKWDDCAVSCINSSSVDVKATDTSKTVTLAAKRNDATLEVTVKDIDGNPISGASVSLSNWEYMDTSSAAATPTTMTSCSSWASGTSDATGKVTLKSVAARHTLNVWPPYNQTTYSSGPSYASTTFPVTLVKNETTTKTVVLKKKDSTITVTCKDSAGTALEQCSVNIWSNSDNFNDWGWGQTDSQGHATINAVSGVRYTRSCWYSTYGDNRRANIGNCPTENQVTVEAPATVSCTFPVYNSSCHFSFVDSSGNALTNAQGSLTIYAGDSKTKNDDWSYPMCSEWASIQEGGAVIRPCPSNTAMKVESWTWQGQYDPEGTYEFTTGDDPKTINYVKIPLKAVNAKINGHFVDQDGNEASPGSTYSSVYCQRDRIWKNGTMSTSTSFSVDVSAGWWQCGYHLDWQNDYAPAPTGAATSRVYVADSGTAELNLKLLKKATVKVKAEDHLGNPKKWVWVTASSCNVEESQSGMYAGGYGCSTNADGICSIVVGASTAGTEYCLFAHLSWNDRFKEGVALPETVSVTCKAGQTCEASPLVFRLMDGEFKIQVKASGTVSLASISAGLEAPAAAATSDIAKGAFVVGYSSKPKCDAVEAEADKDGVAIIPCVGGDRYQLAAKNQIGNIVYISEAIELECSPSKAVEAILPIAEAGAIPSTVSATCKNTDPCSVTLSDRFEVSLPRNACGSSGNELVLKVQPTVTLPLLCEARPVGLYGYDISVTDAEGNSCSKFQDKARICLPLDDEFLAAAGLMASDCQASFLDRSTDSYQLLKAVLNAVDLKICALVDHFTEFVVIGKGSIKAIDGDVEGVADQALRTGEVSGSTGVTESVQGEWGQGVGVDVGDVSDSGEVAGGGNIGGIDSVPISVPTSAGGGGSFFGCTLVPSP